MIIRRYVLDLITGGDSFFKKEIHFSFCRNTEMEMLFFLDEIFVKWWHFFLNVLSVVSDSHKLKSKTTYLKVIWECPCVIMTWWRHQMETFFALLGAGNSPVAGEFPAQKPVTRSFDVFFDLRLNKRLSKQREAVIWDAIGLIMMSLWC